jgi:hypothetical protein
MSRPTKLVWFWLKNRRGCPLGKPPLPLNHHRTIAEHSQRLQSIPPPNIPDIKVISVSYVNLWQFKLVVTLSGEL